MGMVNGAEDLDMSKNDDDDVEHSVCFLGDQFCIVMMKRGLMR